MAINLDNLFRQTVSRQGGHPAIFGPRADAALTYGELNQAIQDVSDKLRQAGVQPGHCIGLHLASGVDYIIYNYAIWRCGGCTVPIPVELAREEKAEICREIALDFVISPPAQMPRAETDNGVEPTRLSERIAIAPTHSPQQHPEGFHDVNAGFIRFTSGTTGSSKGVVLSHESIHERILAANDALKIGPEDRIIWVLSMSYHFTVSIVGYLTFGATVVLPANNFGHALFEATSRRAGTLIYASPMHYALMADYPDGRPLRSLRLAVSTTSSIDPEIVERFYQRYAMPISQALGVIEVGLPCINVNFAYERPDSVGQVLPAYELRMENAGLGPHLREIAFRGPGFLDAYYRPWQTRDQIMPDGWFRARDIGELDEDGCLYLRGRSKDVINVAGMKFFPQEVEVVLNQHDHVAEACVYAHRDTRLGEVPHARVVAEGGSASEGLARELRDYCRARLASYKVPEQIEFVAALPRTASGKLLHREVEHVVGSLRDP